MLSGVLFCIILIYKTPTILYHKEPYPNWQILNKKQKKIKNSKGKQKQVDEKRTEFSFTSV